MAYDRHLAARVRETFADGLPLREQPMFGALAFLLGDRMAVAASADGGLLVRVDTAQVEQLVRTTAAQPAEMRGRTMRGWVHIDGEHLRSRHQLGEWIAIGTEAATSVPSATT
ncbi:TfoX/Sxy family protein [Mycobacterium timonense]|uniref:RNA methyltransferase n=1 Tax=Mycobacterium bouchedurhonense TaxID=701041 RepID=A0AAW5S9P2_MYCBC|nr:MULTISPECIES: TfoX/Sxy family protein [Mycobacterium]MCV6992141.1 TfoX/Sxy family protein [Mycobacterium bouchedurhonense]MCV6995997.1 TfoX/Sxy family protein [Mycobacterium timonense]ORA41993.1 RNA methyltransferase [Mycobacterium bouchedurhonense]